MQRQSKMRIILLITIIFAPMTNLSADTDNHTTRLLVNSIDKMSTNELRKRIHRNLKKNHKKVLTYKQVWKALKYTDEDIRNSNNLILLYSLRSTPKTAQDRGGRGPNQWNREHVWAKSHGFSKKYHTAYTDLHHLRPTDKSINSSRNDLDFAEGGKKHKECDCRRNNLSQSTGTWEPPDTVKGDIARYVILHGRAL